jgi:hypothetical protein
MGLVVVCEDACLLADDYFGDAVLAMIPQHIIRIL